MKPEALKAVDPARFLDLDVRADLRNGREPFRRIMHAKEALADDGILRLRAVFEPEPLYAVLGREGFLHWTERLADDDWRVWFYREGVAARDAGRTVRVPARDGCGCGGGGGCGGHGARPGGGARPASEDVGPEVRTLDVRGLEPPEPMVRTLEALEDLPDGHTLVQRNVRVPRFLFPELESRGYRWRILEESEGEVRVAITRNADGNRPGAPGAV